jgi:molybdopterin/thiamine biosynthesis adenylyltransferase
MSTQRNISTELTCEIKANGIKPEDISEGSPTDRQSIIPHFDQEKLRSAKVGLVGAGGINSEIGRGLARKGVGAISIFDNDIVTMSNYSRQAYFPEDLYQKKALCLPKNLSKECVYMTTITGFAIKFEEALAAGIPMDSDVYVFGVDNDSARVSGCRSFLKQTPVVFLGTGPEANNGYVFVQEPGKTCFACMFPYALESNTRLACIPSSIDILKSIGGIALYAIDSLIMDRPRPWNYREVFLDGFIKDRTLYQERWPQCPVCGEG